MKIKNSAVSWNGSWLPASGTSVEIHRGDADWIEKDEWQIGKTAVVMSAFTNSHGYGIAAVEFHNGHCECILSDCLKPIRTPEQIAAEERDKTINQMEFDTDCLDRGAFTKLYEAGWRKQVTP